MACGRLQSRSVFISKNRLDGENVELDALRALQYEGTPAEIAQGFKEQGNEVVKMKRWKDGKEYYTKGLVVLAQRKKVRSLRSPEETGEKPSIAEDEAEIRKQKELEEACYVNRALCNLELSMFSQSPTLAHADPELTYTQKITDLQPSTAHQPFALIPRTSKHTTALLLLSLLSTSLPKLRTPVLGVLQLTLQTPP